MNSVMAAGLSRQLQVIHALVLREFRIRNSKHSFKQLFDLAESVVFIIGHYIVFTFMHRQLLIGDSLLLFITTGIFPVLIFRAMSAKSAQAVDGFKAVRNIPLITPLDFSIARSFVDFLTFILAYMPFFAFMSLLGFTKYAIPYNPLALLQLFPLIYCFSFGIGLVNSFLTAVFPLWKFIWGGFSRIQIFFSAVFFIPEYMPPQIRDLLAWSPIMHYVALFRTAFYPTYPTHLMSMKYMVLWAACTLMAGLIVERLERLYLGER